MMLDPPGFAVHNACTSMALYRPVSCVLLAPLVASATALPAQTPAEPTAYSVTVRFHITGATVRRTQRLGSQVLVDQTAGPSESTRTLYNLDTKESLSWNPDNPSAPCVRKTFLPQEWQDPFSGLPDLTMKHVQRVGTESIHGIAAEILQSGAHPDSFFRLWVDPQTGLMLKAQFTSRKLGTTMTYFEVTDVSLEPPPPSVFEAPAHCASAAQGPPGS
ncbi:MAG TPA: hypothetical protein VME18_09900 [Acidobacteriaceae bacterium]|nr:hypothetical protein [Acidobacteriaceae bacterium]